MPKNRLKIPKIALKSHIALAKKGRPSALFVVRNEKSVQIMLASLRRAKKFWVRFRRIFNAFSTHFRRIFVAFSTYF